MSLLRVNHLCSLMLLASLLFAPRIAQADAPKAEDFLPVAKGGNPQVQAPAAVEINQAADTVQAGSGQDAMNAARDLTRAESSKGTTGTGACFVKFPSGMGAAVTAKARYRLVRNPTLSRINQRQAVFEAFLLAKKGLAEQFDGLSNDGATDLRKSLARVYDSESERGLANLDKASQQSVQQSVSRMLRSFVIYEIKDEQNEDGSGTVFVTIAVSPKTTLQVDRLAGGYLAEDSLAQGIERVIDEVRSGIVPPLGARCITVPGSDEVAFVGFGSAVVEDNPDPDIRLELFETAKNTAEMYAKDSLCGLLHGDLTTWKGGVVEKYRDTTRQYATVIDRAGDAEPSRGVAALDQAVKSLMAENLTVEIQGSARSGRIPPGVQNRSWFDDDKHWAYAVAVYLPSATAKAEGIGKMMDDAKLLPSQDRPRSEPSKTGDPFEKTSPPPQRIKPLPSGKVGDDL